MHTCFERFALVTVALWNSVYFTLVVNSNNAETAFFCTIGVVVLLGLAIVRWCIVPSHLVAIRWTSEYLVGAVILIGETCWIYYYGASYAAERPMAVLGFCLALLFLVNMISEAGTKGG